MLTRASQLLRLLSMGIDAPCSRAANNRADRGHGLVLERLAELPSAVEKETRARPSLVN